MLLVAVDLGNTRAHIGTFQTDGRGRLRRRTSASLSHAMATHGRLYADPKLRGATVVYASVNPPIEARFYHAVVRSTGNPPLRLVRDFPPLVRNRYRTPESAGLDRLANASAAWARAKRACVAVDLGTAITLDVVNGRGEFVGGLIAPGLGLQAKSLRQHTALLPEVRPRRVGRALGRTTPDAIAAGISLGVEGLIRTALAGIARELGARPRVFGTGGDAAHFRDLFDAVVPDLALEGIAVSYVRSKED